MARSHGWAVVVVLLSVGLIARPDAVLTQSSRLLPTRDHCLMKAAPEQAAR